MLNSSYLQQQHNSTQQQSNMFPYSMESGQILDEQNNPKTHESGMNYESHQFYRRASGPN